LDRKIENEGFTMQVRYSALFLGVLFLILGLAGFVPAFVSLPNIPAEAPINAPDILNSGYGYLFGLFPTNYLHNAVHLVVGILGIAAFTSYSGSKVYLQGFTIAYVLIVIMGLLPGANTVFGIMPIFGNNVWFNALATGLAAYYGFFKSDEAKNLSSPTGV
jgi:hypothetical protein